MFIKLEDANFSRALEIWNDGFSDYLIDLHMGEKEFLERISTLNISTKKSVIYQEDGIYKGIILLAEDEYQNRRQIWIGGICVGKKFRGRKVASKLMEYAKDIVAIYGYDELIFEVISNNYKAIRLYEKLGFKKINYLTTGDIAFNDFNLDYKYIELREISIKEFEKIEDINIPWQNRSKFGGNLKEIYYCNKFLGYISYYIVSENNLSRLFINQIYLIDTSYISSIVKYFRYKNHMEVSLFNIDIQNEVVKNIVTLGFIEKIGQYQLS